MAPNFYFLGTSSLHLPLFGKNFRAVIFLSMVSTSWLTKFGFLVYIFVCSEIIFWVVSILKSFLELRHIPKFLESSSALPNFSKNIATFLPQWSLSSLNLEITSLPLGTHTVAGRSSLFLEYWLWSQERLFWDKVISLGQWLVKCSYFLMLNDKFLPLFCF